MIRPRLRRGRRGALEGGYVDGGRLHPLYGDRLVEGRYEPVAEHRLVIRRIQAPRADGDSYAANRGHAHRRGGRAPGGARWHACSRREPVALCKEEYALLRAPRR